ADGLLCLQVLHFGKELNGLILRIITSLHCLFPSFFRLLVSQLSLIQSARNAIIERGGIARNPSVSGVCQSPRFRKNLTSNLTLIIKLRLPLAPARLRIIRRDNN